MDGWAFAAITFFECLYSSMGKRVKTVRIDRGLLATTVLRRSFGVHGRKQKKMWKSGGGTRRDGCGLSHGAYGRLWQMRVAAPVCHGSALLTSASIGISTPN